MDPELEAINKVFYVVRDFIPNFSKHTPDKYKLDPAYAEYLRHLSRMIYTESNTLWIEYGIFIDMELFKQLASVLKRTNYHIDNLSFQCKTLLQHRLGDHTNISKSENKVNHNKIPPFREIDFITDLVDQSNNFIEAIELLVGVHSKLPHGNISIARANYQERKRLGQIASAMKRTNFHINKISNQGRTLLRYKLGNYAMQSQDNTTGGRPLSSEGRDYFTDFVDRSNQFVDAIELLIKSQKDSKSPHRTEWRGISTLMACAAVWEFETDVKAKVVNSESEQPFRDFVQSVFEALNIQISPRGAQEALDRWQSESTSSA